MAGTEYTLRLIATQTGAEDGTPSNEAKGTPYASAVRSDPPNTDTEGGGTTNTGGALTDLEVTDPDDAEVTLTPTFSTNRRGYTASVAHTVELVTFKPTPRDPDATIAYEDGSNQPLTDADGNRSDFQVDLDESANPVKLRVTPTGETTPETYTVTVTRAAAVVVQDNNAPTFSSNTATREFAEDVGDGTRTGVDIGAPVTADDTDSDSVTVKADDGRGGTHTIAVTINVTDVEELPLVPDAPGVSAVSDSSTSLSVTWTAPTNTGRPQIASYDFQYKKSTDSDQDWQDGPQNRTGTTATISSLDPDTSHDVQVRATNADGDSLWSGTGAGTTNAAENPIQGGAVYLSFEEDVGDGTRTGVDIGSPVTASNHGSSHTYTLDGTNKDDFTIGTSDGQVRTRSGMNYDYEAQSSYSVTVEADDGNGGTESILVTINVTDVLEKPTAPTVQNVAGNTRVIYVTWTAPSNTGRPSILHYDLQYREGNSGPWFNGPQDQTGMNASIKDLSPATEYEVQVRATNKDGHGPWSDEGSATTSQPLPATCLASENENIRLADGYTPKEGRVEVCLEDPDNSGSYVWGSICDDYWTDAAAVVICKTLGYHNSEPIGGRFLSSNFGGRLPILLDDLLCAGNESNILDFRVADGGIARNSIGEHNCKVTESEYTQHVTEIEMDDPNQSAMLSVADVTVYETPGTTLDFAVTLSGTRNVTVTVSYATQDGTAEAGVDYVAKSGMLTFPLGTTTRTASVTVLDDMQDEHDTQGERMTLRLSNAVGAGILDGVAGALRTRGGGPGGGGDRRAADGVRPADFAGYRGRPAAGCIGQREPNGGRGSGAGGTRSRRARVGCAWGTWHRLRSTRRSGTQRRRRVEPAANWTAWGEGAATGDDIAGTNTGTAGGLLETTLTTVYPYARYAINDRLSLWGVLGYGQGELRLIEGRAGTAYDTDTGLRMGALGARGVILDANGYELALRSDAMRVRMTSDTVIGLAGASAEIGRVRALLEGSRMFTLGANRSLEPTLEFGLRHDSGDAETGSGIELGAGIRYADAALGLSLEANARGLVAHQDSAYEEWGAWATIRLDPGEPGRGLSLSVSPTWGAASSGLDQLWNSTNAPGYAASSPGYAANSWLNPGGRLSAELGYGVDAFQGRGMGTYYSGLERAGSGFQSWRLGKRWELGSQLQMSVEGERLESSLMDPNHAISVQGLLLW